MVTLNKEKYLALAKSQGLYQAITALHHELKELEYECFEGPKGYQPDLYEKLKEFREFSRDLWKLNADQGLDISYADMEKKRGY